MSNKPIQTSIPDLNSLKLRSIFIGICIKLLIFSTSVFLLIRLGESSQCYTLQFTCGYDVAMGFYFRLARLSIH